PDVPGATTGIVQGTLLALYRFDRFKSSSDNGGAQVETLAVVGGSEEEAEAARLEAEAQNAARDLQNLPSNVATPEFLAQRARKLADGHERLSFEAMDRDAISEAGMGAFAAVARGTYEEPKLIGLR